MVGGVGVAVCVPVVGAANVLFLWIGALLGVIAVIKGIAKLYTPLDAENRKTRASGPRSGQKKPGMLSNVKEGVAYSRSSALFMTTAIATIATMMALQLIDFEASKIFARRFADSADLAAFLGIVDGLTTLVALCIQWFVVPRLIRGLGVQGTNLFFPYTLMGAFAGLLAAPILLPAVFARFTRFSLMPSLRGTTRTLIFNAVPRKTGALVRSFNTGVVLPVGQVAGGLTLVLLKGWSVPILFPILGLGICAVYVWYTYKQNTAYGEALLELLQENKIHLLDLEDDELRRLDAAAVAAISGRLSIGQTEVEQMVGAYEDDDGPLLQDIALAQEEVTLAAIELLQTIGSPQAFAAIQQHLPYASPRLTAAALEALAAIGNREVGAIVVPYLEAQDPQVRIAAIHGLRQAGDVTLQQRLNALLDDPDVQVRAAALAMVLHARHRTETARAMQIWETMLDADDEATQRAALSVFAQVPAPAFHERLSRLLEQGSPVLRLEVLGVLQQLAERGHMPDIDGALLHVLEDEDAELRERAVRVLTAIGTPEALRHMLICLDDDQPAVREALIEGLRVFGKQAIAPLAAQLQSPQSSLLEKESALLALARLDGVQSEDILPFWDTALHEVYQYKLMLACMERQPPSKADAFLVVALQDAYSRVLAVLVRLLAVWSSPEVARMVESGLYDTDRQKRAQALEALESISERRFTRFLLPILTADEGNGAAWQDVAQRQWNLSLVDCAAVLTLCRDSDDQWVVIGGLLAEHARVGEDTEAWRVYLRHLADTSGAPDVQNTARALLEGPGGDESLTLTDIMLFLKRIPLFNSMSLAQLHIIAGELVELTVAPGEAIFHEGDQSSDLYLIVAGAVQIVQQRGGEPHTIVTLQAGEYFGDMALFEERPRSAGAVAAGETRLLILRAERFRQIVRWEPAISFEVFRELSARLRRLEAEETAAA